MSNQVLVVDDDQLMHKLFLHHLERAGYRMLSATDGREALDIASRENVGAIVMDIMLPEVDGLAALRELKKADATKSIPVIVITANELFMARKEAENCGAAGFLNKPFSPVQLVNEIRRVLPLENKGSS
jgi:CheY-like chemotaxis protein